jgi:excisionase family DNA binding protein
MIERMYTVNETAEVLRKSPKTVRRYIQNGLLSALRSGPRSVVVAESELKKFMEPPVKNETQRLYDKIDQQFDKIYNLSIPEN